MTDQADLTNLSPDDELDLSGTGLQTFEDDFLIVDAGIEETENGRRWFVTMEPTTNTEQAENLPNGQVKDSGYLTHVDRDQLVNIGKSSLKRVFKAVFGRETGTIGSLKGEMIHAQVSEGASGFAQVRRQGPAKG